MNLEELNQLSFEPCIDWFEHTCASRRWCEKMTKSRPFSSLADMIQKAQTHWLTMLEKDFLEAFDAHPMIGDLQSLRAKYASTADLAQSEQSGTSGASEEVLLKLQHGNKAYLDQNGFIFIICATGLSAQAMLEELNKRLCNSRQQEIQIAAEQQLKITMLRINKGITTSKQEKVIHQ